MKRAAIPEVGDLIRQHIDDIHQIVSNTWKRRTMYALARCRTAAMGGHIDQCDNPACKRVHISYNSCRNRHCPKCQGHLREKWINAREADLLNTKYFHVVFTLPHHLNELALQKPDLIYGLLFKTTWRMIEDFGHSPKLLGARMGMIAVLHTCLPAVQDFGRRGDRTLACIPICIASSQQEASQNQKNGKPPEQKANICFR
jgi:hypothetical protein